MADTKISGLTAVGSALTTDEIPVNQGGASLKATLAQMQAVTRASNLLFTDATYDIGASGATRPRDLWLSRNASIGGTLGVTGVITATAGQIAFPATQSASADANTLDDYEEGTWTPVIGGTGGVSGQAYSVQDGTYVKIGQFVFARFNVTLSTEGTITTNVQIQGLPFSATSAITAQPIYWVSLATTWVHVVGLLVSGTVMLVRGTTVAAVNCATSLTAADINDTTQFAGFVAYRASA